MSNTPDASARQMLSFRLLLLSALTLLLSGCLFDGFELPENYRPAHPGATTPVANGAVYRFAPTAEVPATRHLRFIRTGPASYVMEQYVDLHKGKPPNVYVHHARFMPLSGNHYALYWRQVATRTQGYVLARLESRRLVLLGAGAREADLITFAARQDTKARKLATSGFALDTTDEGGVLTFLQKLAANSLTETAYTSQAEVPRATRDAAFEELGPHIVRLERRDLGDDDQVKELATYVRALADEGNGWGHYALARFAANGWGMPTDAPLARVQADAAIRSGVPHANQVYAGLHYHGIGQPANPAAAIPYARRAAEAGVPAAMGLLGTAYRDGLGVQADKDEARRWFRRAADAGRGDAHALWADLVLDDKTAEQDAQALAALETGMKMEDPNAFYLRGFMHENGRGGVQDFAAATAMFLEAAKRRHDFATYLAGERLRRGQGIPQDIIRGRKLVARAAEKGIKEAEVALERTDHVLPGNTCVRGMCGNSQADAKPNPNLDKSPYVFAGLRYGASYQDAVRLFGKPERIESSGASSKLFWVNGKFEVSHNKDTGFINSFTVVGQEGVAFVRSRVPKEHMLKLLDLPKAKVADVMGKPTKIWYHDTLMDWEYAIDLHTQGSIFLECTRGAENTCDYMIVHWSGRITWFPNDGVDSWGLRVSPICGTANAYRNANTRLGFVLSSKKAQTPVWELELFTNASSRTWVLAGKYRDTSVWTATPSSWELCELAQGDGDYREQKWYGAYFGPN